MGWMMVVAPLATIAVILLWVGATLWADRTGGRSTSRRTGRSHAGQVSGGTHVGAPGSANTLGPNAGEVNGETASPAAETAEIQGDRR